VLALVAAEDAKPETILHVLLLRRMSGSAPFLIPDIIKLSRLEQFPECQELVWGAK